MSSGCLERGGVVDGDKEHRFPFNKRRKSKNYTIENMVTLFWRPRNVTAMELRRL